MNPGLRTAAAAAVFAAMAVGVSPAGVAQEVRGLTRHPSIPIDYEAWWEDLPEAKALSEKGLELAMRLHDVMGRLAESEKDPVKGRASRAEARAVLEEYRAVKARQVAIVDRAMKTPPPRSSDVDILRKLRDTELLSISWNKRKYIDCLGDIGSALRINFVIHPGVNEYNTVEMDFPRMSASGILRTICDGFELEAIVYNGEVTVIKKLKRNDERMLKYLNNHPEWKYWLPEPKTAIAPEDEE